MAIESNENEDCVSWLNELKAKHFLDYKSPLMRHLDRIHINPPHLSLSLAACSNSDLYVGTHREVKIREL